MAAEARGLVMKVTPECLGEECVAIGVGGVCVLFDGVADTVQSQARFESGIEQLINRVQLLMRFGRDVVILARLR